MPITKPQVEAEEYLDEDAPDMPAKVGTTVQEGWGAAEALLNNTSTEGKEFPQELKFEADATYLVKFLQDRPFATYEQHWIDRPKGKKSFVCLGDGCPLCEITGDKPRGKFAFNVLVLNEDTPTVKVLTAPPSLARQIKKAHDDERKGPIDREFWELSRLGTGPQTQYTLNYVRGRDLAEEWKMTLDSVTELVAKAEPFTADEVVRETPRSELLEIARSLA